MDAAALISHIRDHYIEQFRAFAEHQRGKCEQGASEVKMQLSEESRIFKGLYCADFIMNDGQPRVIELALKNFLSFDSLVGRYGDASLSIDHLQWDDVLIHHDLHMLPQAELDIWFQRWFDPDDHRHQKNADISRVVHTLLVEPNILNIDLGTAEPEALWEMLDLLKDAGATTIKISSSRAEPNQIDLIH